ncbi:conserved oligomeric Golgi complex subunit 1 [Anoplophora glabripennis]|nr:conserved oligomeric Golgi complex subunit 1 [Anoplophora glabripennis]XP_023310651.1 conserved oligomeric Golgi complex subunit 1 [Anoplophora glabripennis]XP_023310652.1 conserved oligomeric Golgi complex subunit 1 [Anoplophora glabripennis]
MPRTSKELLELDIDNLFEERSVDEIVEIEKLLDAEIERKRSELRSMVGDRYKDVLAASDAIISMKAISREIVNNIEKITNICEELVTNPVRSDTKGSLEIDKDKHEERTLVIQIRLAIFMNEQTWIALDEESNLQAAQYYLLAQHIHTGLSLSKKEDIDRIPLLQQLKYNLVVLRSQIFGKITEKLESVEITAEETSQNLNALMLLENQSCKDLLSIFVEHRKTALNTVINSTYSSVRIQVNAMVRCLVTTVHLLHDCFICTGNGGKGLIWQQLNDIVADPAPRTLSKMELPVTPLTLYIPEIIRQFRPKCKSLDDTETTLKNAKQVLEKWLKDTQETIKGGLEKSLKLVTNVRGLHLVREESLKIELPSNWEQICSETYLPENFDVWYYFFQNLISQRCRSLISTKISRIVEEVQTYVMDTLKIVSKSERSETDLRWYAWTEENSDVSKTENSHLGLTMKTKGYSRNIVELCNKMDGKYLELLEDVSQYLYGKEYSSDINFSIVFKDFKFKRKYVDKTEVEVHLRTESVSRSTQIAEFVKNILSKEKEHVVVKSIVCARFLHAISTFCPNFHKCCTFNNTSDDWLKVCDIYNKTSHVLWQYWVKDTIKRTEEDVERFNDISPNYVLKILSRWDEIEIQEQTEEKVFKSQIKVPLKPCLVLNSILESLNDHLNSVLPHTLPKPIHLQYIEQNMAVVLNRYKKLVDKDLNQIQALQFLFDVKYLTTLCVPRENVQLISCSQEICDKLRSRIDPFDLDVFYSYLQNNVKRAVLQSQMILGCLIPSPNQLASLGLPEKSKEQDKVPSILALSASSSSSWFPLLPITVPSQKTSGVISGLKKDTKESSQKPGKAPSRKSQDPTSVMRQSAASLFGGLTTDWFS